MNRTELFQAGRQALSDLLSDKSPKDLAKGLLANGPAKAAGAAVFTRVLGVGIMPLAASFAVGAVVGAGALVFLAPGGDAMRSAVGEELQKWSTRFRQDRADRTAASAPSPTDTPATVVGKTPMPFVDAHTPPASHSTS